MEETDIRVRAEMKGTFTQGTFASLLIRLFDQGGSATDASSIQISIRNLDTNEQVVYEAPVKLARGIYLCDWQVPGDAVPGTYNVTWTYIIRGTTRYEYQVIEVAEAAGSSAVYSAIMAVMRIKLESMLATMQSIYLHMLQADDSSDFQTYSFPFQRWNQSAGVKVYRNTKIVKTGFEIDYHNGVIKFDKKQLESDVINVCCVFRFFADEDLDLFLLNGLNAFNIFAPHTAEMSYNNIPQHYVPPVLYGAAVDAIRTFMQAIIWRQNRVLFGTQEGADRAFDQYDKIKENYEKQWETLCEKKKLFPYAGLHRLIITPMFSLPGGRARFFRYLFSGAS